MTLKIDKTKQTLPEFEYLRNEKYFVYSEVQMFHKEQHFFLSAF